MHTYTNSNHFKKQLIFNILFISTIIIVIWIISVFLSFSYSEKEFEKDMNLRVTNASHKLDEVMSTLQTISLQASLSNWSDSYTETSDTKDIDYISLNRSISELIGFKALSPVIKNISLFIPQGEIVISDYGISSINAFWQQTFGKELNISSPYITNRNPSTYYFVDNLPQFSNTTLFIKPISIEKKESIFIFLDNNRFQYELYNAIGLDNVSLHVYDSKKNEVITNSSNSLTYDQTKIIAEESDSLIFSSLSASGLTVEIVVQRSMMQPLLERNLLIVSLVMLLLEILLLPASYLLSTRNYKPVKEMIDAANVRDFQDVMDIIKNSFSSNKITKEEVDIYTPLLTTALFNQLRNPKTNVEKILSSLSSLGITIIKEYVRLVEFSSIGGQRILEDYGLIFYSIDPTENKYLVFGDEEDLMSLEKKLREDEDNNIYITFSSIHPINKSYEAFSELDKATKYRNTEEDCYVLTVSEIDNEIRSLDFSSLKSLELAIKSGKAKEARALVENFFFLNIASVMTISSILQIHSKLIQFFTKITNDNAFFLTSFEELRQWSINDSDSISRLMENTNELSQDIIREIKQVKNEKDQKELDEILQYLNSHIQDPSISLSILAERFSVSESTISRIIRQLTGEGFLDYINNARIEKASELLKESEMNINSIALSVGYTNDITFRRLFKKIHGVSPTEYRNCNN